MARTRSAKAVAEGTPLTDTQVIQFLWDTGHFRNPGTGFEKAWAINRKDLPKLRLHDEAVRQAIRSYQSFDAYQMDVQSLRIHARSAIADGDLGPATRAAMGQPRCGHPDYYEEMGQEYEHYEGPSAQKVGSGGWRECHGLTGFHRAKVKINHSQMPSHVKENWAAIWAGVQAGYRDIGLDFVEAVTGERPNTSLSWVGSSSGWIGLALIGTGANGNQRCDSEIWARFLSKYRGSNVVREWITLVMHELGHNCGLQHSSGGIMNPSIVTGLRGTWRGDPHESTMTRLYGGQPVTGIITPPPIDPPPGGGGGGGTGSRLTFNGRIQAVLDGKPLEEYILIPYAGI